MTSRRYAELFFLDEAVAFVAVHFPYGEFRNADYKQFKALWKEARVGFSVSAKDIYKTRHVERAVVRRSELRRPRVELAELPDSLWKYRKRCCWFFGRARSFARLAVM